jgi:hypothetical protein
VRKEKQLAKKAADAAKRRGHKIGPFTFINHQSIIVGRSFCKHCNMMVTIDIQARPIENAIKGEAVELNCV